MLKKFLGGGPSDPPAHYSLGNSPTLPLSRPPSHDTLAPPRVSFTGGIYTDHPSPTHSAPDSPSLSPRDGYFRPYPNTTPTHTPSSSPRHSFHSSAGMALLTGVNPTTRKPPRSMDRAVKNVEALVAALSQLNELAESTAKCHKQIARCSKDLSACLSDGMTKSELQEDVVVNALANGSSLFSAMHLATASAAKQLQKECSALDASTSKMLRQAAKEDRAHDDYVDELEARLRKTTGQFEKIKKPNRRSSFDAMEVSSSTERYISTITSLASDVNAAKSAHAASLALRRVSLGRQAAKGLAACAEVSFKRGCEEVRMTGRWVGTVAMWANFCASDEMPTSMPDTFTGTGNGDAAVTGANGNGVGGEGGKRSASQESDWASVSTSSTPSSIVPSSQPYRLATLPPSTSRADAGGGTVKPVRSSPSRLKETNEQWPAQDIQSPSLPSSNSSSVRFQNRGGQDPVATSSSVGNGKSVRVQYQEAVPVKSHPTSNGTRGERREVSASGSEEGGKGRQEAYVSREVLVDDYARGPITDTRRHSRLPADSRPSFGHRQSDSTTRYADGPSRVYGGDLRGEFRDLTERTYGGLESSRDRYRDDHYERDRQDDVDRGEERGRDEEREEGEGTGVSGDQTDNYNFGRRGRRVPEGVV